MYPLCQEFKITPEEIAARWNFLRFSHADAENIAHLHKLLAEDVDDIVTDFYQHLTQFPELNRFLNDRQTLARLKDSQRSYLLTLGQDAHTLSYFESRLRIGIVHERVGLTQKWYFGTYSIIFELICRRIASHFHGRPDEYAGMVVSLQKVISIDATLAMETYHEATVKRLEGLLQDLSQAQHELQMVSRVDGLTGIHNRKFLYEALEMEFYRSRRFLHSLSLLFIDIDHFKQLNDSRGHDFGDQVIREVVQIVRSVIRPADIIGRYGGEEFIVALVECPLETGQQIAERVRLKVALATFSHAGIEASVTISIGIAELDSEIKDPETLIRKADQGLYKAKESGRNQVCIGAL